MITEVKWSRKERYNNPIFKNTNESDKFITKLFKQKQNAKNNGLSTMDFLLENHKRPEDSGTA